MHLLINLSGGEGIRTLIDSLTTFNSAGERIAALPPHLSITLTNFLNLKSCLDSGESTVASRDEQIMQ